MNPLILKALLGTVAVGTAGTAASFKIYQTYVASQVGTDNPSETIVPSDTAKPAESVKPSTALAPVEEIPALTTNPIVLVKANTNLTSSPKLSVDSTEHDFKCKVSGEDDTTDFCSLVQLDLSKNWIDVNGIKKANSTDTASTINLNSPDNHFKLEVNQDLYDKAVLADNKQIEIISTTTENKKLAKLNVSFKINGAEIDYVSTNYLLGKALSPGAAHDSSQSYECPFSGPSTPSPTHACSIYPFGSTSGTLTGAGYHKQEPTDLLNTKSSNLLTKDQYYILNYTNAQTKSAIGQNKTALVNKVDGSTVSNAGNFNNIVPVIVQGSTNKKAFILSETPSYSIIVKKSSALEDSKSISHTTTDKNYKCKWSSSEAFDCELVELELSDSKTSIDIAGIKNTDLTSPLSIPHTESTIKFFKLDVPLANFQTIKSALTPAPAAVELLEITDGAAKIGDLMPIFAIDDNNLVHFDTSNYIVKSATLESDPVSFAAGDKKYCLFVASDSSDLSAAKECEVKDLGTSILDNTNFTTTTDASSIIAANTYLVTFVKSADVTLPIAQDIQDKPLLVLQVATGEDSSKTKVATFNQEHIKPALVVDGHDSKKYSFILS